MSSRAYSHARSWGASREEAEDFSQWLEMRRLEGFSCDNFKYRYLDYQRLRFGDKRRSGYEARKSLANPIEWQSWTGATHMKVDDFSAYIKHLKPDEQTLLELRFRYAWNHDEIAQHYGHETSWSAWKINKILAKLRDKFTRGFEREVYFARHIS